MPSCSRSRCVIGSGRGWARSPAALRCRLVGDGARSRAQIRAICTPAVTATSARSCRCRSGRHCWRCAAATRKAWPQRGTSQVVDQVLCCLGRRDLTT